MYRSLNVPGSPSSALTTRYFGFGLAFGNEGPLPPGRKPGAAQTAEVRARDLVDDLRRRHRERLPGRDVPATGDVGIQPGSRPDP